VTTRAGLGADEHQRNRQWVLTDAACQGKPSPVRALSSLRRRLERLKQGASRSGRLYRTWSRQGLS